MPADKPTGLSMIKLKTWPRQSVPMISEHSSHSTPLPVGFRTWLWRYTCSLLLIPMLWHRQAISIHTHTNAHAHAHTHAHTHTDIYLPQDFIFESELDKLDAFFLIRSIQIKIFPIYLSDLELHALLNWKNTDNLVFKNAGKGIVR